MKFSCLLENSVWDMLIGDFPAARYITGQEYLHCLAFAWYAYILSPLLPSPSIIFANKDAPITVMSELHCKGYHFLFQCDMNYVNVKLKHGPDCLIVIVIVQSQALSQRHFSKHMYVQHVQTNPKDNQRTSSWNIACSFLLFCDDVFKSQFLIM